MYWCMCVVLFVYGVLSMGMHTLCGVYLCVCVTVCVCDCACVTVCVCHSVCMSLCVCHCMCVCVQAAWSVLADIATTKVTVDTRPVLQYWTDHNHSITGQFLLHHVPALVFLAYFVVVFPSNIDNHSITGQFLLHHVPALVFMAYFVVFPSNVDNHSITGQFLLHHVPALVFFAFLLLFLFFLLMLTTTAS